MQISKSSKEISNKCIEPYYVDYLKGGIVEADKNSDYRWLSFVPQDKVVLALTHGDTYTELETNNRVSSILMPNTEVIYRGSTLQEYVSPKIIVKKNESLALIEMNKRIVTVAKPSALFMALRPVLRSMSVSCHYDKLGFAEAAEFWKEIEERSRELSGRHKQPLEIAAIIKNEFGSIDKEKSVKKASMSIGRDER